MLRALDIDDSRIETIDGPGNAVDLYATYLERQFAPAWDHASVSGAMPLGSGPTAHATYDVVRIAWQYCADRINDSCTFDVFQYLYDKLYTEASGGIIPGSDGGPVSGWGPRGAIGPKAVGPGGSQRVLKNGTLEAPPSAVPRMNATFGARDPATKNMIRWAKRNPAEGYYDVIGHGSPSSLSGMSASELAAKIGSSSGGQNIRLLSCRTGCPSGTFAQNLANRLGVRVMAPTTDIGASGSGKSLTFFNGGGWRWFDPN